jgi:hypothetical protein
VSEGDSNFFSRWSRRKAEVRDGGARPEPVAAPPHAPAPVVAQPAPDAATHALPTETVAPLSPPLSPSATPAPAPTLADAERLTTQSDYTRFMARDVAPDVRQAALKKLFTDPHFNVMDGLDTYIDDYGKPDPLPAGLLRQLVQSQMLGLFDHEKRSETNDTPAFVKTPAPAAGPAPAPDVSNDLPQATDTPLAALDDKPATAGEAAAIPDTRDE